MESKSEEFQQLNRLNLCQPTNTNIYHWNKKHKLKYQSNAIHIHYELRLNSHLNADNIQEMIISKLAINMMRFDPIKCHILCIINGPIAAPSATAEKTLIFSWVENYKNKLKRKNSEISCKIIKWLNNVMKHKNERK